MYRTLFGGAYPFSYDFEDLARYYAAYDRLISHWRTILGDSLHEVVYEELRRHRRAWDYWVARARICYNLGIVMLLAGVALTLVPTRTADLTFARWAAIAVPCAGILYELLAMAFGVAIRRHAAPLPRWMVRMARRIAPAGARLR